nr:MAG TPA: hypothetical protein [Caudoviricetes sp.]
MGTPITALNRIAAGVATTTPRMNLLWATVATVDPLTVILDHDPDETPRPAINAVGALRAGQRVTVSKTDQLLTVTGPVAGELTGGNNAGTWLRHANGIQECWHTTSTTCAGTTAYGSLWLDRWEWRFPALFAHPPIVIPGRYQLGTGKSWPASPDAATVSAVMLCGLDVVDRSRGFPLHITAYAIGFWR